MAYNSDRKGYETKDGGLIRINGGDKVRIDIYEGNEREKGGHTRDTINYDTNTGKGSIDQHNADKSEKSSTDVSCFLTTSCMKYFQENFKEDKEHYYEIAPIIVETINKEKQSSIIYDYIYDNIVDYCVEQIEQGHYDKAYSRYKNSVLTLEEQFARPLLEKRLVKSLKLGI